MNAVTTIIADEGALAFVNDHLTPLIVLEDRAKAEDLFATVCAEIDAHVPDVSTTKGREAIKSLAFKVTKTKTAVDAARKSLTEDWRRKVDTANAAGRVIWDRLEALAAEARKPLTDWEQAEKDRIETVASVFGAIETMGSQRMEDTSADVTGRIAELEAMTFDPAVFGDSLERVLATRTVAVEALQTIHARLVQEEADKAELARLRQEAADREERDRQREKADADALAEKNRLDDIERQAQARASEATQAALDEQARTHQAELDRVADEARKLADEKTERERQAQADADAAAARAADADHRNTIIVAAEDALVSFGVAPSKARGVVQAIIAGSIPHVSITF